MLPLAHTESHGVPHIHPHPWAHIFADLEAPGKRTCCLLWIPHRSHSVPAEASDNEHVTTFGLGARLPSNPTQLCASELGKLQGHGPEDMAKAKMYGYGWGV